jgi:serine/threonine protein kinase
MDILMTLNHKNIIRCLGPLDGEGMILEYSETLLKDVIPDLRYNHTITHSFIRQLLEGVAELSRQGIIHRDIKPENILISRGNVLKISDFGLAIDSHNHDPPYESRVGTIPYTAPEIIKGSTEYGTSVDIWSAGCVIYKILTGASLFNGRSWDSQLGLIRGKCINPRIPLREFILMSIPACFHHFVDLLVRMLDVDPATRITAEQALLDPCWRTINVLKWGSISFPESGSKMKRKKQLDGMMVTIPKARICPPEIPIIAGVEYE